MGWKLRVFVLVIALAWFFNDPPPPGVSEPWSARGQIAVDKITNGVCWTIDSIGVSTFMDCLDSIIKFFECDIVPPDNITITDEIFNGVPVRVYKLKTSKQGAPGLVYYHGGGWTLLNTKSFDLFMINIAKALDIVIISVEYRLAPKYKFPLPLDDCTAVTKHILSKGHTHGIDPKRIAIAGDSSGGNLAAAVALKLRDELFSPMPKCQMLVYPAVQGMDFSLPSYVQNIRVPVINSRSHALAHSLYSTGTAKYTDHILEGKHTTAQVMNELRSTFINHDKIPAQYRYGPYKKPGKVFDNTDMWDELKEVFENPYFSPLLASDLSNLPNAYIYTAQYDVLRDEALLYEQRLRDHGVKTTHVHGKTSFHGVCTMHPFQEYEEAKECVSEFIKYLKLTIF